LFALAEFVNGENIVRTRFGMLGGFDAVVAVMECHIGHEKVIENGLATIFNSANNVLKYIYDMKNNRNKHDKNKLQFNSIKSELNYEF
jgi:hypothetical protein